MEVGAGRLEVQPAAIGEEEADAAHAFGARYRGRPLGALADAACFSLYATKHVAAGEGGLVATNRTDLAERLRAMTIVRRDPDGLYDQVGPAFKASLPDVFAAMALVQLGRLNRHAEIRAGQFAIY